MITYIDQVSATALETDWAGSATQQEIDIALLQANAFLNAMEIIELDPEDLPTQIQVAGVELAKLALKGTLFSQQVEKISSKSASAGGGVSVSKTYSEPLVVESIDMKFITTLLAPYIASSTHFSVDRG